MKRSRTPEGNRNAVLDFHFKEGNAQSARAMRSHLAGCADCREYLGVLAEVGEALGAWKDEAPPEDLCDRIMAQARQSAPVRPLRRRPNSAWPLLGLPPTMAALVILTRWAAATLALSAPWTWLAQWSPVAEIGPWGVTALLTFLVGGLGTLALAPALVMEGRRRGRLWAA